MLHGERKTDKQGRNPQEMGVVNFTKSMVETISRNQRFRDEREYNTESQRRLSGIRWFVSSFALFQASFAYIDNVFEQGVFQVKEING